MKTLTLCGTVIFLAYLVVLCSSGQPYGKNWCRAPLRRNWRLPPRPPQKQAVREPKEKPLWFYSPPKTQSLPGRTLLFLYQHINQKGFKYEQLVGPRCYNLPNVINDQASSLDTNGRCVMVCRDRDCKFCKKMQPGSRGHFNLNEIGMDDVITSIKPCGDVY